MFETIKNTTKSATRLSAVKDTISYTIETLKYRGEMEKMKKVLKEEKDRPRIELIESQIKQHEVLYNTYKDATLRAMKRALD